MRMELGQGLPRMPAPLRRAPLTLTLVLGIGLAVLPLAVGAFGRADRAGHAVSTLHRYTDPARLARLDGDVRRLDGADVAAVDLVATMRADANNVDAANALPPAPFIPWLLVGVGVFAAVTALVGLAAAAIGLPGTRVVAVLVVLGFALAALVPTLQLFTRTALTADLATDLRPLVSPSRTAALGRDVQSTRELSGLVAALAASRPGIKVLEEFPPPTLLPWLLLTSGAAMAALGLAARRRGGPGTGGPVAPTGFGTEQARVLLDQLRAQAELRRAGAGER